jgi:hypothetical protein
MDGFIRRFRQWEGHRVSLALVDGRRIDDCELVSVGRHGVRSVWVFSNGVDVLVAHADVIDMWEVVPAAGRDRLAS